MKEILNFQLELVITRYGYTAVLHRVMFVTSRVEGLLSKETVRSSKCAWERVFPMPFEMTWQKLYLSSDAAGPRHQFLFGS